EWAYIGLLTHNKDWTPPHRQMRRKAGGYHTGGGRALGLALVALRSLERSGRGHVGAENDPRPPPRHRQGAVDAEADQDPGPVAERERYGSRAGPRMRQANEKAADRSRQKLHPRLALLPVDSGQVDYLYERLLSATPSELPVIRDQLAPAGPREAVEGRL